jgi:hypothetical protein
MKKKGYLIGGIIILILGVWFFSQTQDVSALPSSSFQNYASDVIGTKTGTSTAGVGWYGANAATTTYITRLGSNINNVVYTFLIQSASTTPAAGAANLHMAILASNDDYCDTATSTTVIWDHPNSRDINWYDAAPFLAGFTDTASTQLTLNVGTTTIVWNTTAGIDKGRQLLLTDVNARCLALQVNGSSTVVWTQIKTK